MPYLHDVAMEMPSCPGLKPLLWAVHIRGPEGPRFHLNINRRHILPGIAYSRA